MEGQGCALHRLESDSPSRFGKDYMSRFLTALRCIRTGEVSAEIQEDLSRVGGRVRAVKFAADVSLAMTASDSAAWSRSIVAQHAKISPTFVDFIRTCAYKPATKCCNNKHMWRWRSQGSHQWRTNFLRMRRILYSSIRRRRRVKEFSTSTKSSKLNGSCIKWMRRVVGGAWRAEKKKEQAEEEARMETLKHIVPGGWAMNSPLLLEETFDYIQALQMQIHSMHTLLK